MFALPLEIVDEDLPPVEYLLLPGLLVLLEREEGRKFDELLVVLLPAFEGALHCISIVS